VTGCGLRVTGCEYRVVYVEDEDEHEDDDEDDI
jgi:hypothetical protein